jgi:hypothetical protein
MTRETTAPDGSSHAVPLRQNTRLNVKAGLDA